MMDPQHLTEQQIREALTGIALDLGTAIREHAPGYGFALFIFPFGLGFMSCISNANRDDMLAAMKEFIARAEGRYDDLTGKVVQ